MIRLWAINVWQSSGGFDVTTDFGTSKYVINSTSLWANVCRWGRMFGVKIIEIQASRPFCERATFGQYFICIDHHNDGIAFCLKTLYHCCKVTGKIRLWPWWLFSLVSVILVFPVECCVDSWCFDGTLTSTISRDNWDSLFMFTGETEASPSSQSYWVPYFFPGSVWWLSKFL